MNSIYTLSMAFSTVGSRLELMLPLLNKLQDNEKVEIVVVVQNWTDKHQVCTELLPSVNFYWEDSIGLSISRNRALTVSKGQYVWMLDDDVDIPVQKVTELLYELERQVKTADIIRLRVGCTENRHETYKKYTRLNNVSKLNLLQMNSIELVVRREFCNLKQLGFNTKIGLGTAYPGNEEVHFLLDAMEQGATFKILESVFVFHSCVEGGRKKTESLQIMELRGATASRYGLLGIVLICRWGFRYLLRDKSLSVVTSLLKGFVRGYKAYC